MITIVDYGVGNLGSIQNMLKKIGVENHVTSDPYEIERAQKFILPGVGAFQTAMKRLRERGFIDLLTAKVMDHKVPVLGICLGMQLMTNSSEEGPEEKGLKWIDAQTIRLVTNDKSVKVPHKGWNFIQLSKPSLFEMETEPLKFYFDHSYHVKLNNPEHEWFTTTHGMAFTAGLQRDNIFGVQFHPEKSHRYGMNLLSKFAAA